MGEGISQTGKAVEREFRRLTGAIEPPKASIGDALLNGHPIEVKKASSNTLNQVRAVKFIPLVAFDTRDESWYVIPAPDVVRLVAEKSRGQHTEIPFESSTLSISRLREFKTPESKLKEKVLAALAAAEKRPDLKRAMDEILEDSKELARKARERVKALLKSQ